MKLSTRGRYGIRLLLDLALHRGDGLVLLKDIAQRQEISLRYLEHIVTPLIKAGIVRSSRGAKGGILLAMPPENIRLIEIIRVLEGSIAPVECVDNPGVCKRSQTCATRDVWAEIKLAVDGVLRSSTLEDLANRQRAKEVSQTPMYYV